MTNLDTITSNELYVPGEFCCAKCGFTLSQFTLNANTGAIGDRDQPGEKCPNDGSPLWRVTWKQRAQDHFDRCTPVVTISAAEFDALHDALDHPVKPTPSIVEGAKLLDRLYASPPSPQGREEIIIAACIRALASLSTRDKIDGGVR